MRGIRFGYVSTTLLAQLMQVPWKNGSIWAIQRIFWDVSGSLNCNMRSVMLYTLTDEEYLSGLAELIKTGIIGNVKLFEAIERNHEAIIRRDAEILSLLISMAVNFKASVVSEDEKEAGIRRILNFGHTFGHAIELSNSISHGFAVASGMELAARYSCDKGLISVAECERIINLLTSFNLLRAYYMPDDQIARLILHDKKKAGSDIYFVLTEGIGKAVVEKIPVREVVDFYRNIKSVK